MLKSAPPASFDTDGRSHLVEVDPCAYVLQIILDALPSMCGLFRKDEQLKRLLQCMEARVEAIYYNADYRDESERDIEDFLVIGFGKKQ